jgi:integrase
VARRSNQEGSLYQRADGYWVASMRTGGRRIVRYGKTRSEASAKLRDLMIQCHQGTVSQPTKITLQDWTERWLAELDVRPSTLRTYRQVLTPVLTEVGGNRLDRLTPLLLSSIYVKLGRNGMGPRRLQLSHGYLKACLERTVELEILGKNPMAKVQRPKWEPKRRTYWTVEQAGEFVRVGLTSKRRWAPLFVVLVTTGLRISEAVGLTWADIDLNRRTLAVRRAMPWAGDHHDSGPVKTKAGNRVISLTEASVIALRGLPTPTDRGNPVFRTANGNPPRPDHLREPLADLCKEAGVPFIHLHGLRHVAAALAYRATGDPYAVQHRLGHSHISTTLGIYAYGTRSDEQVAGAVDALLAQGDTARLPNSDQPTSG